MLKNFHKLKKFAILSVMNKKMQTSANYQYFIKVDTRRFKGEWIAIADKKIVAHGKDAEEVYKTAQKKVKTRNISLAKVPQEQMLVLTVSL